MIQGTLGNPLLKSEKSINTQLGVVFAPSWLPGFNTLAGLLPHLSERADHTNVNQQTSVNNCFAGLTASSAPQSRWRAVSVRSQLKLDPSERTGLQYRQYGDRWL